MNILAIETSTLTGSIALLADQEVKGEITLSVSIQHSERLMPAIDQLLKDAATDISGIDLFAVATGPGSFTGLRIGIAAAQGLALARDKPVIGVPTLQALAMNGLFFTGLIVPVLNAFRGEVYRGLYRRGGSDFSVSPVDEDRVLSPQALSDELKARGEKALLLGNGITVCGDLLLRALGPEMIQLAPSILSVPRASHVACLSINKSSTSNQEEPVLPLYLRRPG